MALNSILEQTGGDGLKILCLDLDGVLNSFSDRQGKEISLVIVPEKVAILRRIIDETGAIIVLSSSWRFWWNEGYTQPDQVGWDINEAMAMYGLEIRDKIPFRYFRSRADEVREWLAGRTYVKSLVILDDMDFGWRKRGLQKHWVQTDGYSGLTEEDADRAIRILNHGPRVKRRLFKFNKRKEDFL